MNEKKEKKEDIVLKAKIRKILRELKKKLLVKREILRVHVVSGSHKFWVTHPQKIKFWTNIAKANAIVSLKKQTLPVVRVLEVIYKNDR